MEEVIGAVDEVGLRAIVAESFGGLVIGGRDDGSHVGGSFLLPLLLDEVFHEVLLGVDLVVDDLVADAALA